MNTPILCYVTDRKGLMAVPGADSTALLLQHIAQAANAGVDWIQLREKDLDGASLLSLATRAVAVCAAANAGTRKQTRLLVNDRLDVALTTRAAGLHLGESSLPIPAVTNWRARSKRTDFLVGASCHSRDTAQQAAANGADYILFGPVFTTPSKRTYGPPQGLQNLEQVCRSVSVPVLAIGGITPDNAAMCFQAGAAGIAAIRLFQQSAGAIASAISRIRS